MNELDQLHQQVVDALADELLRRTPTELREMPAYGSVPRTVAGRGTTVGWWRWERGDDVHHIVFQVTRRLRFCFHRKFTSGVAFGPESSPRRLTPEEAGDYD